MVRLNKRPPVLENLPHERRRLWCLGIVRGIAVLFLAFVQPKKRTANKTTARARDLHALGHGQCRARLRVRTSIFLRTLFPGEISVTRGRFFVARTIGILRRDRSFPLVPSRVGPVFFCANRQARPKNRAGLKSHSTHPICISHPICRITLLLLSTRIV